MSALLENFKKLLESDPDNALLHFSLGNEYFKSEEFEQAEKHLRQAVKLSPEYSAAWKMLGKSLSAAGQHQEAIDVFHDGIKAAEDKGDIQAAKEMKVFLKRAEKSL